MTAPLIDRIAPVLVGQHDHPVHVRHHRTQHAGVALVELETVPVGDVAGHDHDRGVAAIGAVRRPGLCASDLEVHPGAAPGPGPDRDQIAEPLGPDGLERRRSEGQIGRVDQIEHRRPDEIGRIPVEHLARHGVGVQEDPVARDRENRITQAIE